MFGACCVFLFVVVVFCVRRVLVLLVVCCVFVFVVESCCLPLSFLVVV